MKFNFKKISAIASSVLLAGMTMGVAAAANYPSPFVDGGADVAVVYGGADALASDQVEATNIQRDLQDEVTLGVTAGEGAEGEREEEVPLGGSIVSGDIAAVMTDSNIPSLLDEKISWDDGNGSDDYDVHEEIRITKVYVNTSLDDEEYEEHVAMGNDRGLEYRYVFDDALDTTAIGDDDADDLFLDIFGTSYEITSMDETSITVAIAEEYALKIGESVSVSGKTFTVDDVFSGSAQINGEIINEDSTEKIDGIRVKVEDIGYHSNEPEKSSVILKIGSDITKSYENGEEYIGEDEDDPLWIWTISDPTSAGGYIGIKYDGKNVDASDNDAGDSVKYAGDSYVFPEDFAVVTFNGLTDVSYEDITVEFDEVDLYNLTDSADPVTENAKVVLISAPDDTITVNDTEASDIALFYADNDSGTMASDADGQLEVFYKDMEGDYTPSGNWRWAYTADFSAEGTLAQEKLAYIEIGDTNISVEAVVSSGDATLIFADADGVGGEIAINVSGDGLADEAGTLEKLGDTVEDADENDIVIDGVDVSTKEEDRMNDYGIIVVDPEGNADKDEVVISVPDDRVYADISVLGTEGSVTTAGNGVVVVKDSEVSSVSGKNLIVVGGSCINSVAAEIIGGALCGPSFTSATDVGTGQYLIESVASPYDASKIALLVAGYEAADTVAASTYLRTQEVDTAEGNKYIGTSSTEATLVVD